MSKPLEFTLKPLATKPKLNASLAERTKGVPALMESRKITPEAQIVMHADFDGDGDRDQFVLEIKDDLKVGLFCEPGHCTLWAPQGTKGIAKLIPGDINGDGSADFYMETKEGQAFALENTTSAPRSSLTREAYAAHLKTLHTFLYNGNDWWKAVDTSIGLTFGMSHTWVVPDPKPRYPWIDGTPRHTDCVIDFERAIAELHAPSAKFSDFQRTFNDVQYYDYQGHKERTDFFTEEAVPHLTQLGIIEDLTDALFLQISPGIHDVPKFTTTINKENWYKGLHNGQPSGKDFPEWRRDMTYIPFGTMFAPRSDTILALSPTLARALPPISIMVIMNQGRVFEKLGTEIPDSHVAYLIKDPRTNEVHVHHSTPTTDLNLAAVTTEDLSSFMLLRYCQVKDGKVVSKDNKAIGIKILALVPPHRK